MGEEAGVAEEYGYLGVQLDQRQRCVQEGDEQTFLQKLRSFNACSKMLEIFFQSVMGSTLLQSAGEQHQFQGWQQDQHADTKGWHSYWTETGDV